MKRILITGALGQIGSELTVELRRIYGDDQVIATDIRMPTDVELRDAGPFEFMDCLDPHHITRVMQIYNPDTIYHLAAVLSAVAEAKPNIAWQINVNGLYNILEAARQYRCALFFPSSIGAFGKSTPKDNTPQDTLQRPDTIYGVTKVTGELICDYYHKRFGLDTRGVRFPGLISYETEPGGGTTDYAVEIFWEAVKNRKYTCYLNEDTSLDMMYMPDALKAMIGVMEADPSRLVHRNAFNVTAMAFTPAQLAERIRKHIPDFKISYNVDPARQAIADSWPNFMDDSAARKEWDWNPDYDFDAMVDVMIKEVTAQVNDPAKMKAKSQGGKAKHAAR